MAAIATPAITIHRTRASFGCAGRNLLTGLRRLIAELEDAAPSLRRSAAYRALIEAEIAAVLERRQRWPLIPSAGRSIPAPYWREAARTIAVDIKVAYEDAALPVPSENHRAAAVAVILNSLGEVEAGSVRDALSEQP